MKTTVKLIAAILSLAMMLAFVGCNKDEKTPDNTNENIPSDSENTPVEDEQKAPSDDENKEEDNKEEENKPSEDEEKEEEPVPEEDPILCQLKNSTNEQMMGYVFKTSDGKIIVIDGGTTGDTDNLLSVLKKMSGEDVPHIDAWILTHPHSDHINAFVEIMKNRFNSVSVDKIYYNFPDAAFVQKYESSALETLEAFEAVKSKFADKLIVSEVGDKYTIGTAKIDVLFVFDETITFNPINNSSMIFRLTAAGKRMMFLGDAYVQAGNKIIDDYGIKLFADYCQMAHHGQAGVTKTVYEAIWPSVCFWDAPEWLWNDDSGSGVGSGPWDTLNVRSWIDYIGVEVNIVQKDGNNYFNFASGLPMSEYSKNEYKTVN